MSNHEGTIDPALVDDFRAAMRRVASSVTVITSGTGNDRRGLTATAVCSLSMTPPSILVCVNRFGEAHEAIQATGAFCVNILADEDQPVAERFAGQAFGTEKFDGAPWTVMTSGAPSLESALASIDCLVSEASQTESHTVFFGRVVGVRLNPEKCPLVHFDRQFVSIRP